jgi:hypothetical protein
VTRLISRGDVVLRLQGSGLYDLKPDRCVASDQINSYLEPDGRSGIMSPLEPLAIDELSHIRNEPVRV